MKVSVYLMGIVSGRVLAMILNYYIEVMSSIKGVQPSFLAVSNEVISYYN